MGNQFDKKFNHDKSKDIFGDPKELALAATQAGLSTIEFVKLYRTNLQTAEVWNTVDSFVATISNIVVEEVTGGFKTAFLEYVVRAGKENEQSGKLRIGILSKSADAPINRLCTKVKEARGKLANIYKVFRENNGAEFAQLGDIDVINN